ncbi:hypothetical protein [Erythrobacter sp. THAF29]|uniref:hypothetical protein n=1 Tax=Erythrobacter sp. THAF29 TaxID=2587851 RepID=UPI001267FB70|nr:hypothetical protein [Erythrobacter sp. THAF29]QFT76649.1 hypothetical protein FIU90_03730 [Erythrobacter sp. THAF29]
MIATRTAPLTLFAMAGCYQPVDEPAPEPQDMFWQALSSHCGKAYVGELVSNDTADTDFAGAPMVMHVAECSDDRIEVPFHVELDGEWDRSRTWVFTRTNAGLRLKHDHRHEDGEPDAVTMYGGDTADEGTARIQAFPVDRESIDLFEREGLAASVTNIWTVEVDPAGAADGIFAYQLQRTVEGGAPEPRFFRVEFDVTRPVDAPPPAWGHESAGKS